MKILRGIGASPGIAVGKVMLIGEADVGLSKQYTASPDRELARLSLAVDKSIRQLNQLIAEADERLGEKEADILRGHILMLEDRDFTGSMENEIKNKKINAEWAVINVRNYYVSVFLSMNSDEMKERSLDIKDTAGRILNNLADRQNFSLSSLKEEVIIAARDLTPSETIQMNAGMVKGILTESGGRTSHSAIIARSLGIPAIVGIQGLMDQVREGSYVAFDGEEGKLHINPTQDTLQEYLRRKTDYDRHMKHLLDIRHTKSETRDGYAIEVAANISSLKDLDAAIDNGAEGVGLFRTEFMYMDRDDPPSEEEQFAVYKAAAEKMGRKPVVIRSLDIGGDKAAKYLDIPKEENPFLGFRGIRLCLSRKDLLITQLKAILRAAVYGNLKIMFPMITTLGELREAEALLEQAKEQLRNDEKGYRNQLNNLKGDSSVNGPAQENGVDNVDVKPYFKEHIEVGIMIETPSAAIISDHLAREADFFSIGTNDLTQYTMAADRLNDKVSGLYSYYQPALLRLIKMTVDNASKEGIPVGMCGEAAGESKLISLWIGMGIKELSASPVRLPEIKDRIRSLTFEDTSKMVKTVLNLPTDSIIKTVLDEF